jgi:hypothetical protein
MSQHHKIDVEAPQRGATVAAISSHGARPISWAIATALLAAAIVVAVAVLLRGESKDIVVGLGAALATTLVTLVLAVLGFQERQQEARDRAVAADNEERERGDMRREQRAFSALEYFTGDTQRRNVGIAIIEGSWRDIPYMRRIYIPLLTNQASYLLEKSGQKGAVHEIDNCKRIVELLITWSSALQSDEFLNYRQLIDVIKRRSKESPDARLAADRQGVDMPVDQLLNWNRRLAPLDAKIQSLTRVDGGVTTT